MLKYTTRSLIGNSPAFLTPDRSEGVEMAVDIRRATETPANVLYGTLRRPTECNAVDAARSAAAVDWV